jgi:hypothetical protein
VRSGPVLGPGSVTPRDALESGRTRSRARAGSEPGRSPVTTANSCFDVRSPWFRVGTGTSVGRRSRRRSDPGPGSTRGSDRMTTSAREPGEGRRMETAERKPSRVGRRGRDRERVERDDRTDYPALRLQRRCGNRAVQRLVRGRTPPRVQPTLAVGRLHDRFEGEAGGVSEAIVRAPEPGPECSQNGVRGTAHSPIDLRARDPETSKDGSAGAPDVVHEVLRSPGRPLDPSTRRFVESRFGHDFGRVWVHTGTAAAESARGVGARAYTVGGDVVFGAPRPPLTSRAARRLLAHELVHTTQQSRGPVVRPRACLSLGRRPLGGRHRRSSRGSSPGRGRGA